MFGRKIRHHSGAMAWIASTVFAAALVCALLPASAAAELHPNDRGGWLVGFAAGGGTAGVSANGSSSDREFGAAGFFRAGYAFNPELSLEVNSNGWTKDKDGVTISFGSATAALNYYPGSTGLVLRAGIGGGRGEASVSNGNTTVTAKETGFAVNAGLAYEFRVLRTFALGPQVDFGWTTLDSFDANWFNFGLGFNWYFLPKQEG